MTGLTDDTKTLLADLRRLVATAGPDSRMQLSESMAFRILKAIERIEAAETIPDPMLRDLFAMASLIAIGDWTPTSGHPIPMAVPIEESHRKRAAWAYREADAMLAARSAKP